MQTSPSQCSCYPAGLLEYGSQAPGPTDLEGYANQAAFKCHGRLTGYAATNWSTAQSVSPAHSAEDTAIARLRLYSSIFHRPRFRWGPSFEFKFYDPAGAATREALGHRSQLLKRWVRNGSLAEMLVAIGCHYNGSGSLRQLTMVDPQWLSAITWGGSTLTHSEAARLAHDAHRCYGRHHEHLAPRQGPCAWSVDGVVAADNIPSCLAALYCRTIGSANASDCEYRQLLL